MVGMPMKQVGGGVDVTSHYTKNSGTNDFYAWKRDNIVYFAGNADITNYGTPVSFDSDVYAKYFTDTGSNQWGLGSGTAFYLSGSNRVPVCISILKSGLYVSLPSSGTHTVYFYGMYTLDV